mmetsp:Transcript_148388/g.276413  ORF Transcript_148388/g.276413 Transcript_148388/m.276413 type:complete len:92 (+) Transcript_148388:2-277(+)
MGKEPTDLHDHALDVERAVAVAFGEKAAGRDGGNHVSLLKRASTTFSSRPPMVRKLTADLLGVLKKPFRQSGNHVVIADVGDHSCEEVKAQ